MRKSFIIMFIILSQCNFWLFLKLKFAWRMTIQLLDLFVRYAIPPYFDSQFTIALESFSSETNGGEERDVG
ncbi:hypothetical protein H5410_059446 [Solanum commersonii]|uniref:Uncharacterized protein n=1 Tax=Solanum commersonii TaxID=4109 RepID=A0A9J5W2X8_SOLCO|nr:hypothetical protein H5410_059446 [Solanum commersonii]